MSRHRAAGRNWHAGGVRLTPRERWLGGGVVVVAAFYIWFTLQPELLLSSTTPNGGDTGAHVWWPAFLRDHVLPHFRLSGWAPDWYAGFPVGHFYFPLPALLIIALDVFLPYNIAFKLVTVIGPVALPAAAYVFARGIGAKWPAPPLFAVATLPFLFYTGYQIWGGNLYSTLAGEFSFTIAIATGLCFLGTLAQALQNRTRLALPAALLAVTVMCHIIVAVFAAVAAVIIWLWNRPLANLGPAAAIGAVGAMLSAVWTLPLVFRLGYTSDMGWEKLKAGGNPTAGPDPERFPLLPADLRWAFVLAVVGVLAGLFFLRKPTLVLLTFAVVLGLTFVHLPEGRLWNARLLPFYYLTVMFLAAMGIAEVARALGRIAGIVAAYDIGAPAEPGSDLPTLIPRDAALAADAVPESAEVPADVDASAGSAEAEPHRRVGVAAAFARRPQIIPWATSAALVVATALTAIFFTHETRKDIPAWIRWNYTGYENKGAAWTEFQDVLQTMNELPPGRALWEPSDKINSYGTSLALELLPHFTDGKIGSMEGLYFESAGTTPSHFKMVAELANRPSNPVRNLRYGNLEDFDRGVQHMRMFGVRYFMAQSDEVKTRADSHPDLKLVAETGQPSVTPVVANWKIYEVVDHVLVEPLRKEPVVVTGTKPKDWVTALETCPTEGTCAWWEDWFDNADALDRPLASGGPSSWERATPSEALELPEEPLQPVQVSEIDSDEDSIRFKVSRTGIPVVVKTSYFPNWEASGADGPWRLTPNLMVVVPTEREVSLRYGRTPVDYAGFGLTLLGFAALFLISRWRLRPFDGDPEPADGEAEAPEATEAEAKSPGEPGAEGERPEEDAPVLA